jgi:hypothetical protein
MSNLVEHAERELRVVGYTINSEDEMDLSIYYTTMEIVKLFASVGHSGGSASVHTHMINRLLQFQSLTPLTDNPDEWVDQSEFSGTPTWQNKRSSDCFSEDGGQTYYSVDEFRTGWRRRLFGLKGKTYTSEPREKVTHD